MGDATRGLTGVKLTGSRGVGREGGAREKRQATSDCALAAYTSSLASRRDRGTSYGEFAGPQQHPFTNRRACARRQSIVYA